MNRWAIVIRRLCRLLSQRPSGLGISGVSLLWRCAASAYNQKSISTFGVAMAFWRRKKDEFVSLGLNRPAEAEPSAPAQRTETAPSPAASEPARAVETNTTAAETSRAAEPTRSGPRTPWQTSVLGLDLSIEELQAQEAALEQEFSARFRRAVAATRESLSERIDAVFAGAKQIDANLLDELEEALIAA